MVTSSVMHSEGRGGKQTAKSLGPNVEVTALHRLAKVVPQHEARLPHSNLRHEIHIFDTHVDRVTHLWWGFRDVV